MSYINAIQCAVPEFKHSQGQIAQFMEAVYDRSFVVNKIYAETAIAQRHSVLRDFGLELEDAPFFSNGDPSIEERMAHFFREAPPLALKAIGNMAQENITHLVTVSCTGLAAPGLEIEVQKQLGLSASIQKSTVNFMGCYAAIHALRQADWICKAEPEAKVLIVCVELCTLHFQQEYKFEYLASGSLFADGASAVLVSNEAKGLKMSDFYTVLRPEAEEAMSWKLSSKGFLMNLSSKVANMLEQVIRESVERVSEERAREYAGAEEWAVHPGGRKIVDVVKESFKLSDEQVKRSYHVLEQYGNMSSPTILFILKDILENSQAKSIHAVAFGPGLTIEGLYLERA